MSQVGLELLKPSVQSGNRAVAAAPIRANGMACGGRAKCCFPKPPQTSSMCSAAQPMACRHALARNKQTARAFRSQPECQQAAPGKRSTRTNTTRALVAGGSMPCMPTCQSYGVHWQAAVPARC